MPIWNRSRPRARARDPRGPSRRRRGGQHDRRARRCPAATRAGSWSRPRFLQLAAAQPGWPAARLAELGPPQHALGRHPALVCRNCRDGSLSDVRADRRRRSRSHRPAGLVARQAAVLRVRQERLVEPLSGRERQRGRVCPMSAEFAGPAWTFGMRWYGFLGAGTILACFSEGGRWHLGTIDVAAGRLDRLRSAVYRVLRAHGRGRPGDPARRPRPMAPAAIILLDPASGQVTELGTAGDLPAVRATSRGRERSPLRARTGQRPCLLLSADQSRLPRPSRRAAAADRQEPWRPDRQHVVRAPPVDPVLDLARLCGMRRQLRRQHRLRPRLSRAPERAAGARSTSLDCIAAARFAGGRAAGRSAPTRDHRRQRRRLHHAVRADLPRHLPRRRQPLRRERSRGAGQGHPQVREPLSRPPGRTLAGSRRASTARARRSTTSIACPARSSSSRVWRTGWCRRTRRS